MNVDIINPFLDATIFVLETMAQVHPIHGKPYLKKDNLTVGDVTGIIGLTGKEEAGSVSVSFSKGSALKVVSNVLKEHIVFLNIDVREAIAELTNTIAGNAKTHLSQKGYSFRLSLPIVIIGQGHIIEHQSAGVSIVIPFNIAEGPFTVEACFGKVKTSQKEEVSSPNISS